MIVPPKDGVLPSGDSNEMLPSSIGFPPWVTFPETVRGEPHPAMSDEINRHKNAIVMRWYIAMKVLEIRMVSKEEV